MIIISIGCLLPSNFRTFGRKEESFEYHDRRVWKRGESDVLPRICGSVKFEPTTISIGPKQIRDLSGCKYILINDAFDSDDVTSALKAKFPGNRFVLLLTGRTWNPCSRRRSNVSCDGEAVFISKMGHNNSGRRCINSIPSLVSDHCDKSNGLSKQGLDVCAIEYG